MGVNRWLLVAILCFSLLGIFVCSHDFAIIPKVVHNIFIFSTPPLSTYIRRKVFVQL